jgi:hypothetical protein
MERKLVFTKTLDEAEVEFKDKANAKLSNQWASAGIQPTDMKKWTAP